MATSKIKSTKNPSPRRIEEPKHRTLRLTKKLKTIKRKPLSKARKLFRQSLRHLTSYKRTFGGITLVYLLLTILFVKGLAISEDVPDIKSALQEIFSGASGQVVTGIALFGLLASNIPGASNDLTATYQSIVVTIVSLAIIWALRQTHAGKIPSSKTSFYQGMYPLVPFLLVLGVIALQLLPLVAASWLFSTTVIGGLAINALEVALWSILSFLLAILSIYMVCSSVFALYIVTLPEMTPLKALRSARELVLHRRWTVIRKVLFLPAAIIVIGMIITIPVILYITPIAEWYFFILSTAVLAVSHSYMYSLYRELL